MIDNHILVGGNLNSISEEWELPVLSVYRAVECKSDEYLRLELIYIHFKLKILENTNYRISSICGIELMINRGLSRIIKSALYSKMDRLALLIYTERFQELKRIKYGSI